MRSPHPSRALVARSILALALHALVAARAAGAQVADPSPVTPPPSLAEYADTAALRAALAQRPALADTGRAARIVIASFDTLGHVAGVRPLVMPAMPASLRDSLLPLVKAHLRPIAPRPRGWETHLLLSTGPGARVEETTVSRRNAELADRTQLTRRLQREVDRLIDMHESLPAELTVRLRLAITTDGLVDSVFVLKSSGLPAADEAAIRVVRPSLLTPAVIEGHVVRTSVILPIRFVFPDG
jgi:TonB family protein